MVRLDFAIVYRQGSRVYYINVQVSPVRGKDPHNHNTTTKLKIKCILGI